MPSSVNFWVGLDVHKESITAAVFRNRDPEPIRVDRLLYDIHKLRRYFQRLQAEGAVRACYEASGAGYVLQRSLTEWGVPCELAAPSLIPQRTGERRKSDRRDAIKIGRDLRDDRLVLIQIPTEADERARDLVRCRETFQREIVKSRHYILKFMRRRGFIYREGTHWTARHLDWIRRTLAPGTLAEEDQVVLAEYLALLEYKLQRRDDLDRRIEDLALTPRYKPLVDRLACFRGFKTQAAMASLPSSATCAASRARASSWPMSASFPASTPPGSDDASAPSPRPATHGSATSSSRPPGIPESVRPWAHPCAAVNAARIPPSSSTPGSVSIASTPSFTDSQPRSPDLCATAVAREMVGFLWAVLRDVDVSRLQEVSRAA